MPVFGHQDQIKLRGNFLIANKKDILLRRIVEDIWKATEGQNYIISGAFKLEDEDVIVLNPTCFDGNPKELKKLPHIRINDHNSFSIVKDSECANGKILRYIVEYYSFKDVIKILYMFLFRKAKKEYLSMMWISK